MIYFDNAATSLPKPQCVIDAVSGAMQSFGGAGRGGHEASLLASRAVYSARAALAKLFGAKPEQVAFTSNATESLNTVITGLLNREDHVITTALEHNSVLRPLYRLKEQGLGLSIIPADKEACLDYNGFQKSLKSNTKAVICTHASNVTGDMPDIGFIGEFCEKHGLLFILDASQTAGTFPIDMSGMKISALVFTGHKSLFGPQGTGGLCLRDGLRIPPLKVGGSGIHSFDAAHPAEMPEALEAGTQNAHGIAGLLAGVRFINETGMDVIREKESTLAEKFRENVAGIGGIRLYGGASKTRAPIIAMNIADVDSGEISGALADDYGIYTRSGAHCAPLLHKALGTEEQGAVRFSFSYFNDEAQIDAAIAALSEIAGRFA